MTVAVYARRGFGADGETVSTANGEGYQTCRGRGSVAEERRSILSPCTERQGRIPSAHEALGVPLAQGHPPYDRGEIYLLEMRLADAADVP